jgi:hypothetical protein
MKYSEQGRIAAGGSAASSLPTFQKVIVSIRACSHFVNPRLRFTRPRGLVSRSEAGPAKAVPASLCTLGKIRTCDTRFRKPVLYPLSYEGVNLKLRLMSTRLQWLTASMPHIQENLTFTHVN